MNGVLILRLLLSTTSIWCITISPPLNYTTFVSNISTIVLKCTGTGSVLFWIVDGEASYTQAVLQRGVRTMLLTAASGYVSSCLIIPTTPVNNNTEVVCKVFDVTLRHAQYSPPQYLRLQGPLDAPHNISVATSNISSTIYEFSWGAPFSLHISDHTSDIFHYTLCCNISILGCRTIPSDPDCAFPRVCTSSVDLNESQQKAVKDIWVPVKFIFFAVNGAGNGEVATVIYAPSATVTSNTAAAATITSIMSCAPSGTHVSSSNFSETTSTSTLVLLCVLPGAAATLMSFLMIAGVTCFCVRSRKEVKAAKNPSYHVSNKMAHCIIENMEPCPAYAQIHVPVYDDVHS